MTCSTNHVYPLPARQSAVAYHAALLQSLAMPSSPHAVVRASILSFALGIAFLPLIPASTGAWEPLPPSPPGRIHLTTAWAGAQQRNTHRLATPPLDEPAFILDDVALKQ